MDRREVYQEPSEVEAEGGVVEVNGPDAVDVALTPDAADETSDRLLHASLKARGQLYFESQKKSPKPPR